MCYLKCLFDLNNALKNCTDLNIIETTKGSVQDKILNTFIDLSEEKRKILNIDKITIPLHIDNYLNELDQYVYGMSAITNEQINKLFKKEKKLKLPDVHSHISFRIPQVF